jgi:hypothetical protein
MSHLHGSHSVSADCGGQSQTLILTAGSHTGFLHTVRKGREKIVPKRFKDAHAALTWCLEHHAAMMLFWPPDPKLN